MSEDAQEQNAGEEPSMEDILASIRRILSEDKEEAPAEEAAAPEPAPEPEPEEERCFVIQRNGTERIEVEIDCAN